MSFTLSGIKSLALKVKESVSSNLDSSKQSSSTTSGSNSMKIGLSSVLQSVKSGSAAVRKQLAQTAENLLSRTNSTIEVFISPSQFRYILENLGNFSCTLFL